MVVTHKVEHTVHGKKAQLPFKAVAVFLRLFLCSVYGYYYVAEDYFTVFVYVCLLALLKGKLGKA